MATWYFKNNSNHVCKCYVQGRNNAADFVLNPGQTAQLTFSYGYKCIMAYNWTSPEIPEACKLECCYPVHVVNSNTKWCGIYMYWKPSSQNWWCRRPDPPEDPCHHPCGGGDSEGDIVIDEPL